MSTAMASGGLEWTTTNVHFRGDNLVVEGYFQNQTRVVVDRINRFDLRVRLVDKYGRFERASESYEDIRVHIRPGETMERRFVIRNVNRLRIANYNVKWRVNYHFHGRPHHEHHDYYRD